MTEGQSAAQAAPEDEYLARAAQSELHRARADIREMQEHVRRIKVTLGQMIDGCDYLLTGKYEERPYE